MSHVRYRSFGAVRNATTTIGHWLEFVPLEPKVWLDWVTYIKQRLVAVHQNVLEAVCLVPYSAHCCNAATLVSV